MPFSTLYRTSYHNYLEKENLVFKSEQEFLIFLNKADHPYTEEFITSFPGIIMPDFDKEMVMAVLLGGRTGYGIEIQKVLEKENILEVYVKKIPPDPNLFYPQVISYPAHFINIKKSDKLRMQLSDLR